MTVHGFPIRFIATLVVAALIAPLATAPAVTATLALAKGDLAMLVLAPFSLLTIAGLYAYMLAALPVFVLGTGLAIAADANPAVRPKWIWAGTGALFGAAIGAFFAGFDSLGLLAGAGAGAACATLHRVIIGTAFEPTARCAG